MDNIIVDVFSFHEFSNLSQIYAKLGAPPLKFVKRRMRCEALSIIFEIWKASVWMALIDDFENKTSSYHMANYFKPYVTGKNFMSNFSFQVCPNFFP